MGRPVKLKTKSRTRSCRGSRWSSRNRTDESILHFVDGMEKDLGGLQQRVDTAPEEENEIEEVIEGEKGQSSGLTQIEGSGPAVGEMSTGLGHSVWQGASSQPATVPESQYVGPVVDAADEGE